MNATQRAEGAVEMKKVRKKKRDEWEEAGKEQV
jgi:hypothetical protein